MDSIDRMRKLMEQSRERMNNLSFYEVITKMDKLQWNSHKCSIFDKNTFEKWEDEIVNVLDVMVKRESELMEHKFAIIYVI